MTRPNELCFINTLIVRK